MSYTLTMDDYLAQESSQTWLIEPLIPIGGKFLLYGDPKIGKSFVAIQLAEALAGHRPDWLGFPVLTPGPVLYTQLDTPRSLWQERIRKLRATGLDTTGFHMSDRETFGTWPFNILNPEHATILRSAVSSVKPSAVIIDTLKETNPAPENDSDEQQRVMAELTAATQPAALVLIHHAKKPAPEGVPNLLADIRGSSYFAGAVDTIARLTDKGMWYVGRAIEGGVVYTQRMGNGLIEPVAQTPTPVPAEAVTLVWDEARQEFVDAALL